MKCEYVTFVWWFRGGSTNNPLGSIVISILKDSYPPPSPLPVWDIRVRNLKQQNPKWWISKWRRCQERVQRRICVAALHLCHHSALSVDMSSSSCGPTSASNHFDFQAIHKKNSQTEQWKLERSKNDSSQSQQILEHRQYKFYKMQYNLCSKAHWLLGPNLQVKQSWNRGARVGHLESNVSTLLNRRMWRWSFVVFLF